MIRSRYREARLGAGVGITANLILSAVKAVVGVLSGSYGLIADALHSLSDVLSSIVVLVGLWYAQRPPDENHPYGHARAEAIAATTVAGVLFLSGIAISWGGANRLMTPIATPALPAIWVAAGAIVVKELLYQYKVRIARRTGSRAVEADAWHHRSDALSSAVVLAGLGLTRINAGWWWADAMAGLAVGVVIALTGLRILTRPLRDLMDEQPEGDLQDRIRGTVADVDGVHGIEKVWIRRAGLEYSVDIHVEVDPEISVREGHAIAHRVSDRVRDRMPEIRNVLVHIEPAA